MADDKATSAFMGLPLEVRHAIFEHTAACNVKPKNLLRSWFEKRETLEMVAKHAASHPEGPAPQVVYYHDDYYDESSESEEEAEEEDSDDEGEDANDDEANQDQDDEDEVEDEDEDENEESMDQDVEEQDSEIDMQDEEQDDQGTAPVQTSTSAQAQTGVTTDEDDEHVEADIESNIEEGLPQVEEEDTGTLDAQNGVKEDGDDLMTDEGGEEEAEEDENGNATANAPKPAPSPAPILTGNRKWCYIPNFMRLTHCPPPVELLLACKQLNNETKNWFYDVAVLRIKATASWAHTSFFEEAFNQVAETAFSPMENIRKVEVTFVWDTTWIRADDTGCVEAIFPALLRQRAYFVYQILMQAPDLREVVIHWHDSAQDSDSASLKRDVLEPFDNLPASVKIVEHYIPADSKPHNRSIAGKQRVEFQNILDAGLDRLF